MLAMLLSASLGASATALPPSAKESKAELPTLTTAGQAHSLSSAEAARAYPIHLRAVVTYFDPNLELGYAALFVHDSTGSIYVKFPAGMVAVLPTGSLVDVRGVSSPGTFAPIVAQPQVQVVGQSNLPQDAPRMSFHQLMSGAEDGQWVEAVGVIHSVFVYGHTVLLQMAMIDGTLSVMMVREPGAAYSDLIDAKVRVHGNAAPLFNRYDQMIGVRLMAPNLSVVKVVEQAPGDPFQQPLVLVDDLLRWSQVHASPHRVHLRGIVTLQWPGTKLCIHDSTRGICAPTGQDTHLDLGDVVDVIGFAGAEDYAPILTDEMFIKRSEDKPVAAQPVTAEQALLGKHDSEVIQIDGQLIGYDLASSDTTLLLTSGTNVFSAVLPKSLAGSEMSAWKVGSKLRITGVCSVRLHSNVVGAGIAEAESFRVLMRSPGDVVVVESPSWWTAGHALLLLALALTGALAILGWVIALRNRVEQQTRLLRKSEELFRHMALHDALTGLATRLLLQDRLNVGVETARRHQTGLALLMVDIDRFKETNDTYGHQAGDEVLRVTADRLLHAVRKSDTVARMGGDEFIVLLPDLTDPHVAEEIATNIVKTLAIPIQYAGDDVPVSVSVGVCTGFAAQLDGDFLLGNADIALYQAKARGRNCFQVATPGMTSDGMNQKNPIDSAPEA
jgi:diguanylate cyclase (GGDEF)-like protein